MAKAKKLHLYHDDSEFRVAESPQQASADQAKDTGFEPEHVTPPEDWEEMDDDFKVTIPVEKTAAEWAKERGRGIVGFTED